MADPNDLYQEHSKIVYRYLLSLTKSHDLAEELTQETFYQAVKNIDRFDHSCSLATWLCAIAKRRWLEYLKKNPPNEDIDNLNELTPEALTQSAEQAVLSDNSYIEILKKIHSFQEPLREIMHLRLFGDLSFKQIGDIFGKSEVWARVTFYRGKEKLRKELLDLE